MKDQLLELFGESLFRFQFRCDRVLEYISVVPFYMDEEYCDIKVEFFDNHEDGDDVLYQYETFKDISERYKLFQVIKLPILCNEKREVLFHQKFDEDEFY